MGQFQDGGEPNSPISPPINHRTLHSQDRLGLSWLLHRLGRFFLVDDKSSPPQEGGSALLRRFTHLSRAVGTEKEWPVVHLSWCVIPAGPSPEDVLPPPHQPAFFDHLESSGDGGGLKISLHAMTRSNTERGSTENVLLNCSGETIAACSLLRHCRWGLR